jgi:glutamyl/glutaminyl-tRNA synthetase
LIKSDGYPTYNFAHIIDDAEMHITHVIRGQEFIASQPNYMNLYEALNIEQPIFATMPHIMAESGNKKLGKRDGAKDMLEYLRDGYLPETMINFLASLGWNDGTEQEIFSIDELIAKFSLNRVHHSGARFDEKRLEWMNGQHIRELSIDDLYNRVSDFWSDDAKQATEQKRKQILTLVQDRLKTLKDLPTLTSYFFAEPVINWLMITDNKQLSKLVASDVTSYLTSTKLLLETTDFDAESIQAALNTLLETTGQKPGVLFSLIRIAVSWAPFSPALNDTLSVIGKDIVLTRLQSTIDYSA